MHRSKHLKEERKNKPYWDFNRVVLSGWLIRYPDKFFAVVKFPLYLLLGVIVTTIWKIIK